MLTLGFATTPIAGRDGRRPARGGVRAGRRRAADRLPARCCTAAFNRRETLVTLLESRAGAPAWGPEILWRHQRIGILDSLPPSTRSGSGWAADVAESHSAYFVLPFFRSPDPLRSWLTGLLAVLDSAALYLALCPTTAPSQARLCLRMGFTCLRTLADTFSISVRPRSASGRADRHQLRRLPARREASAGHRVPDGAHRRRKRGPHFRGWRVNYESAALALAERIVATPGPWMGGTGRSAMTIPTKRPVDRTPDEPEGTKYTQPGSYEDRASPSRCDARRTDAHAARRRWTLRHVDGQPVPATISLHLLARHEEVVEPRRLHRAVIGRGSGAGSRPSSALAVAAVVREVFGDLRSGTGRASRRRSRASADVIAWRRAQQPLRARRGAEQPEVVAEHHDGVERRRASVSIFVKSHDARVLDAAPLAHLDRQRRVVDRDDVVALVLEVQR